MYHGAKTSMCMDMLLGLFILAKECLDGVLLGSSVGWM